MIVIDSLGNVLASSDNMDITDGIVKVYKDSGFFFIEGDFYVIEDVLAPDDIKNWIYINGNFEENTTPNKYQ